MAKRGILEHEKTLMLAEELGIMDPFAVGVLEVFWHYVAKYHPDGDLSGVRPSLMAKSIRYADDPEVLVEALKTAKFIDRETMYVHDWHEHSDDAVDNALARAGRRYANGRIPRMKRLNVKERSELIAAFYSEESAQKPTQNIDKRTKSAPKAPTGESVRTPSAQEAHEKPLPEPMPEPMPEPKPEAKSSCAEASSAPPLGTLPCLGEKSWPFTQADVDAWQEAYPAIDVMAELRKDREWLKANPRNMKTPGGMRKHVNGWLSRAQNEARGEPERAVGGRVPLPQPGYNPDAGELVFTEEDIASFREKRSRGGLLSPAIASMLARYDRQVQDLSAKSA